MGRGNGNSGGSFKDLRELQAGVKAGLIQVVSSDAAAEKAVGECIGELSNLWGTRLEYAKAMLQGGSTAPVAELFAKAEALAFMDHLDRMNSIIAIFRLKDGKVNDGLRYAAHLVGIDIDAELKTSQRSEPTLLQAPAGA